MKMFDAFIELFKEFKLDNKTVPLRSEEFKELCRYVGTLPKEHQCNFVLTTPSCSQHIPVYKWLYCDYTDNLIAVGISIIVLLLICLFIMITSIADTIVVPCIETIATKLRMSDTLAGVTVLAFGNGAPDVLTALASKMLGLSQVFYTALAGGCMFVVTCVAGVILIIRPFHLDGWPIIRELLFLLISYFILFTCFEVGVINFQMCLTFVALYVLYISMVLLSQWGGIKYVKTKMQAAGYTKLNKELKSKLESKYTKIHLDSDFI